MKCVIWKCYMEMVRMYLVKIIQFILCLVFALKLLSLKFFLERQYNIQYKRRVIFMRFILLIFPLHNKYHIGNQIGNFQKGNEIFGTDKISRKRNIFGKNDSYENCKGASNNSICIT